MISINHKCVPKKFSISLSGSELYSPLYPKSPVPLSRDRSVPVRSVVDSRTSTLLSSPMHSTQSSSFADLTATSGEQAARKSSFDRRSPASKDATSYSSAIKDAKVYSSTTSLADALKVSKYLDYVIDQIDFAFVYCFIK